MKFKLGSIVLLFFLISCAKSSEQKKETSANYNIRISTIPEKIELNEPFDILLRVVPSKLYENLEYDIEVDANMPAHNHGMLVTPEITKQDKIGHYYVNNMLFHMRGEWELKVLIKTRDSTEVATFNFEL